MDVERARETAAAVQSQLADLDAQMHEEINALELSFDPSIEPLDPILIKPRSADLALKLFALIWRPFRRDVNGRLRPDWE